MSHDQLAKTLIATFFPDFLRLAAPDSARRLRQWEDTDLRKELLVNWIETYVQLSGEDAAEYQRLLDLQENKEIRQMQLTWLGKAEARGIKKGRAETVDHMRQVLLRRIEQRFGAVPERVQAKIQSMKTVESLAEILEKLPLLRSADDLLPRRNGRHEPQI